MLKSTARAIVRLYPSAWRRRYGAEVLDLINDGPVRLGDVSGLLRHGITERVLSLYEPSRHISAFRLISGLTLLAYIALLFLAVLAIGAIPVGAGYLVQRVAGPLSPAWIDRITWLYLLCFVLMIPAYIRFFRMQMARISAGGPLAPEARKLRWIIIAAYAMTAFLSGLEADPSSQGISAWTRSWFLIYILWEVPEDVRRWPGQGLFETLGRLRVARYDLRWARMELERCEGLYEGREPGPELRAARAEMDRLTAAEAEAMAALDAMGYHARFSA